MSGECLVLFWDRKRFHWFVGPGWLQGWVGRCHLVVFHAWFELIVIFLGDLCIWDIFFFFMDSISFFPNLLMMEEMAL